ncbi:hypothetical protein [Streptomyces albipurpureus]|uniref:Integral membrane protein n=1 Tax=Streptomyces albipurpureus TaxID=2897419 RepID=A0ABT0UN29_9ACTN|nr:hypothetical protein [Streptomyces sp. CWNU-1]MCM2389865.1 hypothetical protein [Streptomyces sp. CWNU-1]
MAETEVSVDEDALYVLTAVLLTPAQFPSALGDDFPAACAALGVHPRADGYGLVIGQDGDGARWTVVVDDVPLVAVAIAAWDCGMAHDLSPSERTVVIALPGWPLSVAVAAPGVPEPHDPEPEEGDVPPLSPPNTEEWGPAQRRLGADEIALQWSHWRQQIDDGHIVPSPDIAAPPPQRSHDGLREAMDQARRYLESPPPIGRVRSTFAPGGARTLRADGPGWSMVARTDDMAFFLLDEEPHEVLPVSRGSELPDLLDALDLMAVRPG